MDEAAGRRVDYTFLMRSQPIKLLVVDHFPVVRAGLRAMLKAADITVVGEADEIDEVLRRLDVLNPDLVLAGIGTAEAEVLDLVARVKEKRPRVSVIVMTPAESTQYVSRALALGCSGYLQKRIARADLLKAVRAISRGECIVDPKLLPGLLKEVAGQRLDRRAEPRERLTPPEQHILRLITEGRTNRQIAQHLRYGVGTVKDYVQRIIQKLEVSDRTQAAVKAVRLGLLDDG